MTRVRRFTISDFMILIVIFAVWFFYIRWFFESNRYIVRPRHRMYANYWGVFLSLLFWSSVALLILRMRKPRASVLRISRQPGFAACVAVVVCFLTHNLVYGVNALVTLSRLPDRGTMPRLQNITRNMIDGALSTYEVASGIMLLWFYLAVSGRWRAEPSWIDRSGRLVGILWLIALVLNWVEFYLHHP